MSKFEQNMTEIFDVNPIVRTESNVVVVEPRIETNNLEDDLTDAYNQSRDNLQELIEQGRSAMDEMLEIAKQSQHPRSFEVYGNLLKNVVEANKELLSIQKQMRDMDSKRKDHGDTNIDKAIFIGSTAELSKLIKGK